MGLNELVVRQKADLVSNNYNNSVFKEIPTVGYSLVDSSRYMFEYQVNDDIQVNMFESDRTYESSDFVDVEFENAVNERDYSYYTVAVASGVLTGLFGKLKLSEEMLEKIREWKDKDWNKYITIIAQMAGYKKSDVKGAIVFLSERFVPYIDDSLKQEVKDGINNWLSYLSCHPSVAGLVFSLFTQYSRERYIFKDGSIEKEPVPEHYTIGRNLAEKMAYAILYWIFNLAADYSASKLVLLDEMKIPKEVIKMLKELCKLPLFSNIPMNRDEFEIAYSAWIKKLFEDSKIQDDEGTEKIFDIKKEIDSLAKDLGTNLPILINECIVRLFYLIKKLIVEIKEKEIRSFENLNAINVENILPFNNRLISRMVLISSGCFVGVNVAGATLKAIKKGDKCKTAFATTLLTEINVAGVGRFIFACVADSQYWNDDIKAFMHRREKNRKVDETAEEEKIVKSMVSNDSFKVLSLDPAQARALYSLENILIEADIARTENEDNRQAKQLWLNLWQNRILSGFGLDSMEYFVKDEKAIYDAFYSIEQTDENRRWFYLLTMELAVFTPYYPLGTSEDSRFKKLDLVKYSYLDDQFIRRQTIVTQAELDSIRIAYKKYKGLVSGSTQNTIIAVGVAGVAAAVTGGLAFVFAPGIATLIAGEAVVGLHGAALTSASLAFVGGGSLAAGGFGMAGGTAIITGGGALLGLAGSSSASMAAIIQQTGSDYWERQTTKLLTFSKCVLKDRIKDKDAISAFLEEVKLTIKGVEDNIKELEKEECSLDKDVIKSSKECLKYLERCKGELEKIIR